jgi:hypothetical protein
LLAITSLDLSRAADAPDGPLIAERFQRLNRHTAWRKVEEIPLAFATYHPQGMITVGNRIFLSSVQVIDRTTERGRGHLFKLDASRGLSQHINLDEGSAYHPGGIDFDGQSLWIPVAEYRPNSRSVVFRVDPESLRTTRVFEFDDHLGAIVCDRVGRQLVAVNWGSRRFYRWDLRENEDAPRNAKEPEMRLNPSHYVDYQDGQHLPGTPYALFGGLAKHSPPAHSSGSFVLGGLELMDLRDLRAVHQLPVMLQTSQSQTLLQNPWTVRPHQSGLRFLFIPEDDRSTLYVYDAIP